MTTPAKDDLVTINPNRSAFVLMVAFLSIVNSLAALLPAADQQEFLAAYPLNFFDAALSRGAGDTAASARCGRSGQPAE